MVLHFAMDLRDNTQMQLPSNELNSALQAYINQMPFVCPLGISVKEASRGFVSLSLKPARGLLNHFETYQAGSIFTLAEVTGGVLCGTFLNLSENLLITKKGEIAFLKATSKELIAEAVLEKNLIENTLSELKETKKADIKISVTIKTNDGEPVSECHFIYYLRLGIPKMFKGQSSVRTS